MISVVVKCQNIFEDWYQSLDSHISYSTKFPSLDLFWGGLCSRVLEHSADSHSPVSHGPCCTDVSVTLLASAVLWQDKSFYLADGWAVSSTNNLYAVGKNYSLPSKLSPVSRDENQNFSSAVNFAFKMMRRWRSLCNLYRTLSSVCILSSYTVSCGRGEQRFRWKWSCFLKYCGWSSNNLYGGLQHCIIFHSTGWHAVAMPPVPTQHSVPECARL